MALSSRFLALGMVSLAVLLGACAMPTPTGTPGPSPTLMPRTPTPQPASDEEAIRQLILLEGEGVVRRDIDGLMDLWAPDAVVVDARHTPDRSEDDWRWPGRDAIRERYIILVFPGNPAAAAAVDVRLVITGDVATADSSTVIGGEVSPGGDRWEFVKRDGRWWINTLTYNLEER